MVVASLTLVQQLAEHFYTGYGGLGGGFDADDFDFFANFHNAALHDRWQQYHDRRWRIRLLPHRNGRSMARSGSGM